MKLNQKGFETLTVVGLLLISILVGGIGWYVWSKRDTADKSDNSTVEVVKEKTTEKKEKLPDGYVKYNDAGLGLMFAYPKEWGQPIQIDKNSSIVTLAFANTKVPAGTLGINGDGGYDVVIYANNGKQDLTIGGRGGALWDCVGYKKINSGYTCRNIFIKDGNINERIDGVSLQNTEIVKSATDEVLLAGYNYFFDEVYGSFINLKTEYYGAFIVTHDNKAEYKAQLKVLASTVEVYNPVNIPN